MLGEIFVSNNSTRSEAAPEIFVSKNSKQQKIP